MESNIVLRNVIPSDLQIFFEHQLDTEANHMAAFTARDPTDKDAFMAHWIKNLNEATNKIQTILFNGQIAGSVSSYEEEPGKPEVTYWIGKEYWGQGIATRALSALLLQIPTRPIYARAAKDNIASLRILEKCGFIRIGEDRGFANARNQEVEEFLLKLK